MIEILAKTKDPTRVQPHLSKCFEAIERVIFDNQGRIITMISPEGETVKFFKPVTPDEGEFKGNVEKWMKDMEIKMKKTMRDLTYEAQIDYSKQSEYIEWVKKWPSMCIICVDQYKWTSGTERALQDLTIDKKSLIKYKDSLNDNLLYIVEIVKGKLTNEERKKVGSLITLKVHDKDLVEKLIKNNIMDEFEFEWKANLR